MSDRRPTGAGSEESVGGSGGRGVLLLAIAVVIGIVILQATDDTGSTSNITAGTAVEEEEEEATTTSAPTATTVRALRAPAEVKVLPANGTAVSGMGARVADRLKSQGYANTLSAVDASTNTVETTVVQYTPDFGPEAQVVAAVLGLPVTVVRPLDTPPVRDTRGAEIVVLVGKDLQSTVTSSASGASATATTTASG